MLKRGAEGGRVVQWFSMLGISWEFSSVLEGKRNSYLQLFLSIIGRSLEGKWKLTQDGPVLGRGVLGE